MKISGLHGLRYVMALVVVNIIIAGHSFGRTLLSKGPSVSRLHTQHAIQLALSSAPRLEHCPRITARFNTRTDGNRLRGPVQTMRGANHLSTMVADLGSGVFVPVRRPPRSSLRSVYPRL